MAYAAGLHQAHHPFLEEMRGFSIGEASVPVIVASAKGAPRGRIFTLLHEQYLVVVRDLGKLYIRLVLEVYYREAIISADLSDYLGGRLRHLPRLEQAIIQS
jgi:hypothetical protein